MIAVRIGRLEESTAQALLRPVRWDLEPVTPGGRRVGLAAGQALAERLAQMGDFSVGGAVVTPGGDLANEFIIHVVIESLEEPVTETGVRRALTNGLRQACAWGVESVALPPLGTGAGNLEAESAARVLVAALEAFVDTGDILREATIVVANEYEKSLFEGVLERVSPDAATGEAETQGV